MRLTLEGDDLDGPCTIQDQKPGQKAGEPVPILYPHEARPDCQSCEKPDLSLSNIEVVNVFNAIAHDAQYNFMSGHRIGLRFEAVARAIEWFYEAGQVTDRDRLMRRIWILDRIYTRIHNERIPSRGGGADE